MEAAGNEKSMKIPHVIVLPYPSQGHINPLLQFAKRLAAKGVKATFATTFYTVNSIRATNVVVEPISDGFDNGGFAEAKKEDIYINSFRENGSRDLSQIIEKFKKSDFPVNCIIYDSFLPWALDVAKEHGIYGASFFTNSAAVCAVFSHIHDGSLTLPVVIKNKPLILPGLPPFSDCDMPGFIRAPESYPAYLAMKMSQFSNLEKADYVFANTFEELEGQEAKSVSNIWPAKLIGPMVPSAYLDNRIEEDKGYGASLWKPLSEKCVTWLKSKPNKSVIYISFGSMVSLTSKQMEEMATALMSTNSYFLWVVRETEHNKLPAGFFDLTEGKGLVVSWCNQLEMLAHQAIGCFVTHCGWNSTIEGLCLGLPMVGMPQWSDQMPDAKYIEDVWRVGVRAKEDESGIVSREELLYCLKQVMEGERGEEIKRNARKWRELAKEAIDEGGTSDKCISEFVGQLKSAAMDSILHNNEKVGY